MRTCLVGLCAVGRAREELLVNLLTRAGISSFPTPVGLYYDMSSHFVEPGWNDLGTTDIEFVLHLQIDCMCFVGRVIGPGEWWIKGNSVYNVLNDMDCTTGAVYILRLGLTAEDAVALIAECERWMMEMQRTCEGGHEREELLYSILQDAWQEGAKLHQHAGCRYPLLDCWRFRWYVPDSDLTWVRRMIKSCNLFECYFLQSNLWARTEECDPSEEEVEEYLEDPYAWIYASNIARLFAYESKDNEGNFCSSLRFFALQSDFANAQDAAQAVLPRSKAMSVTDPQPESPHAWGMIETVRSLAESLGRWCNEHDPLEQAKPPDERDYGIDAADDPNL